MKGYKITKGRFTGIENTNKINVTKDYQVDVEHSRRQVVTDVMTPTPNADSLQNGTQIKYFLEHNTVGEIRTACLRFQVRVDGMGDAVLAPVPFWFSRIEIYNRSTGKEISRLNSDTLFTYLNVVHQENIEQWADLVGYNPKSYRSDASNTHTVGVTKYYYLPLVAAFFEGMGLDLNIVSSELEIRLHPVTGGVVSSGVGVPKLLEVGCVFETVQMALNAKNAQVQWHAKHVETHVYLDSQEYVRTGLTMAPGTRYEIDLDQFTNISAGLLISIRPSSIGNVNTDNGRQVNYSLHNGLIDIVGVSGESIYGGGRPAPVDYLQKIVAPRFARSNYFDKCSVNPLFFGNFAKAMQGSIDGYFAFDGSKKRLQITTPQAQTIGGYTWNISAVATKGYYRIGYKECLSREIAWNEIESTVQTIVNNLQSIKDENLSVVITGAPYQADNMTILVTRNGQAVDVQYGRFSFHADSIDAITVGTSTVPAVVGWLNQSYDITLTNLHFKAIHQDGHKLDVTQV